MVPFGITGRVDRYHWRLVEGDESEDKGKCSLEFRWNERSGDEKDLKRYEIRSVVGL